MFTARRSTRGPRWSGCVMASSPSLARAPGLKETRIVDDSAAAASATTDDGCSLGIPLVRIIIYVVYKVYGNIITRRQKRTNHG